jgi:hypothetical protein
MSRSLPHAGLWPRLPESTHGYVAGLLAAHPVDVRLSRPRRTKLGDHRAPTALRRRHRISVNEDLNPYAFLTTLLHEIAHAATWESHRARIRRVRPHGSEWKAEFERILQPVVAGGMLPDDIDARLTDMSTVTGKSRNQLIIEILSETFDREDATAEADRIFDKLIARDAGLLERLADA